MDNQALTERLNIVIVGHVDHGKSTIVGRLLADTDSLPQGKLQQIQEMCRRNSKPFEYAFLLDALKDERSQGITIDAARIFFKTAKRYYIIIDAPGHIEFLRNMVTGASHAEAALLVIDAEEGIQENSRRHGYLLSLLGIRQLVVLVNKMDLVGYSKEIFEKITTEYGKFLGQTGLAGTFIPISGMQGDNIAARSGKMPWYTGKTVLETLDSFVKEPAPLHKPFRMPVQDVYKFTAAGDKRRIVAGTVESGNVRVGDELIFYPSGKSSIVKTLEQFNAEIPQQFEAGTAAALTLQTQIYIARGQIAARAGQPAPQVSTRLQVSLFWMGKKPLVKNKEYILKIGTARQPMVVEEILRTLDAAQMAAEQSCQQVNYHNVADCILRTARAIAFDPADVIEGTGRFVIVDDYEIRGGGIVRKALPDAQENLRDYVMRRNQKWALSEISRDQRQQAYRQRPCLVIITGRQNIGKKALARAIEQTLFSEGRFVFFMGIANVLYGVDADIKKPGIDQPHRPEHLRRLGEVANLMLESGLILVVTAIGLTQEDLRIIQNTVDSDLIEVIWLGDEPTDIETSLVLSRSETPEANVHAVLSFLKQKGILI
ncbi:GTP-binding protein [Anaerohalosphaeraceae bacterium U12dextr]